MKVIAVVGSASGSGKTRLVCTILREIHGLGAVKISPRDVPPRVDWGPGEPGKDTARFAAAGAAAVARIVAPRTGLEAVWEQARSRLEGLPGVVVEGAGALQLPAERFAIFVAAADTMAQRPWRNEPIASAADWIVRVRVAGMPAWGDCVTSSPCPSKTPLVSVSPEDISWADTSLLDAIRRFLF